MEELLTPNELLAAYNRRRHELEAQYRTDYNSVEYHNERVSLAGKFTSNELRAIADGLDELNKLPL